MEKENKFNVSIEYNSCLFYEAEEIVTKLMEKYGLNVPPFIIDDNDGEYPISMIVSNDYSVSNVKKIFWKHVNENKKCMLVYIEYMKIDTDNELSRFPCIRYLFPSKHKYYQRIKDLKPYGPIIKLSLVKTVPESIIHKEQPMYFQ